MTPFIVRFAQQLPTVQPRQAHYDAERQVMRVCEDGHWMDAVDAREPTQPETTFTKVHHETTDDT